MVYRVICSCCRKSNSKNRWYLLSINTHCWQLFRLRGYGQSAIRHFLESYLVFLWWIVCRWFVRLHLAYAQQSLGDHQQRHWEVWWQVMCPLGLNLVFNHSTMFKHCQDEFYQLNLFFGCANFGNCPVQGVVLIYSLVSRDDTIYSIIYVHKPKPSSQFGTLWECSW